MGRREVPHHPGATTQRNFLAAAASSRAAIQDTPPAPVCNATCCAAGLGTARSSLLCLVARRSNTQEGLACRPCCLVTGPPAPADLPLRYHAPCATACLPAYCLQGQFDLTTAFQGVSVAEAACLLRMIYRPQDACPANFTSLAAAGRLNAVAALAHKLDVGYPLAAIESYLEGEGGSPPEVRGGRGACREGQGDMQGRAGSWCCAGGARA